MNVRTELSFLEIEKVGIREAFAFRTSLLGTKQRNHSVLVRDQRVGANQNLFDPTQHRGVRSDSER